MNDLSNELPLQEPVGTALEIALKAHRGQRDLVGSVTVRQHHIMEAIGLEKIEAGLVLRH